MVTLITLAQFCKLFNADTEFALIHTLDECPIDDPFIYGADVCVLLDTKYASYFVDHVEEGGCSLLDIYIRKEPAKLVPLGEIEGMHEPE